MAGIQDLSDDELRGMSLSALSDDELRAMAGNSAPPQLDGAGRVGGFLARYGTSGLVKGAASIPAAVADSVVGVGRDIAYGGKLALSKTGAVEAPNPKNYYGEGSAFPFLGTVEAAADKAGRAASFNRIEPDSTLERVAAAGIEGVTGALSGSGVGATMARAGNAAVSRVGRFLAAEPVIGATVGGTAGAGTQAASESPIIREALPEWAPAAIGIGGGLLAGTALSGGRAALGYDPVSGQYIGSYTRAGQERTANTIVQSIATNPRAAARSLRNTSEIENAPDFVAPGYREISTNAAQDSGIAAAKQNFGDMAGGRLGEALQSNNSALTRAFEQQGAAPGAAETARAQAGALAERDLPRFGLTASGRGNAPEPVRIDDYLADLRSRADLRRPGVSSSGAAVAREAEQNLRAVAEPRQVEIGRGPDGAPIFETQYWASPERLQSFRQDVSESLAPPRAAGGTVPLPSAAQGRRAAGRIMGEVDDTISQNVPEIPAVPGIAGAEDLTMAYPEYMARQRGLRGEADQRSFMAALMEDVAPTTNATTGSREFKLPKMSRIMDLRNIDKAIPGSANRSMSISRLDTGRQTFLEDMQDLARRGNFQNQAGSNSRGSGTDRNLATSQGVANVVRESRAPWEKAVDAIPGTGFAGRLLKRIYSFGQEGQAVDRAASIRNRLGAFETDRDAAIGMLTGPVLPERGLGISAARQGERTARYGYQGVMASQPVSKRRKRRKTP